MVKNKGRQMRFTYDKSQVTTEKALMVSVGDLRDLVQAINIPDDGQRLQELKLVLASVVRKNLLKPGAIDVTDSE